jgi:hypothetical protein
MIIHDWFVLSDKLKKVLLEETKRLQGLSRKEAA